MVDWLWDEVVMVADEVRINDWSGIRQTSQLAKDLSTLLSTGQLHPDVTLPGNFRSVGSIQRKSYDIATQHPDYSGKKTKGSPLDKRVLNLFLDDALEMHVTALSIRALLESGEHVLSAEDPDILLLANEGFAVPTLYLRRERNPRLRASKISSVTAAGKPIACEVCGFDFAASYGMRGEGYIEVHHVRPLHDSGPVTTRLSDLALLCSNCHRMVHRNPWITPSALAKSSLVAASRRGIVSASGEDRFERRR